MKTIFSASRTQLNHAAYVRVRRIGPRDDYIVHPSRHWREQHEAMEREDITRPPYPTKTLYRINVYPRF